MATRAEIIDATFRDWDRYPEIVWRPIGEMVVDEVERMGKDGPYLSTACALIEQESGGKNLFGCDWGSRWTNVPPYCNVAVTKERVQKLIQNVHKGGGQNGVGLTQLTSIGYVQEAEKMGGAHEPRFQCRVGFRVLNDEIAALGWPAGAAAYNAGRGNWAAVMATYGASMSRKQKEWAARLSKASDAPGRGGEEPEVPPSGEKPGKGNNAKPDRVFVPRGDAPTSKDFWKAIEYLRPAIGKTNYWIWKSGDIPDGPGAYAHNEQPPPIQNVIRGGVFCAGVTNLLMRACRKRIPTRDNPSYDGGIAAYFRSPFGAGYFDDYDATFDMAEAKRWADATDCGVMLGRRYRGPALNDQGHVSLLLPKHEGKHYVLQSNGGDGLNWKYTIEQSHDGFYYELMVHPKNWLLYKGDEGY